MRAPPALEGALLGAVQGLTEWLPVSSSAHLRLARAALGGDAPSSQTQAFDVALHLGTGLAAAYALRADLVRLVPAGIAALAHGGPRSAEQRLAWQVALSVLPAAAVGAVAGPALERRLGAPAPTALLLGGFGIALAAADLAGSQRHRLDALPWPVLGGVALAQAAALAPGVSRSGITLTAARALGVERSDALRLSALLSVPVTLGAVVRTLPGLRGAHGPGAELAAGVATSTVIGAVTLRSALKGGSVARSVTAGGYRVLAAAWLLHRAAARR